MSVNNSADAEIDQLYEAWSKAFQRKDVPAILDLLTPDYVLWPRLTCSATSCDLQRLRRGSLLRARGASGIG